MAVKKRRQSEDKEGKPENVHEVEGEQKNCTVLI